MVETLSSGTGKILVGQVAQMPLAGEVCGVAVLFEDLGNGDLLVPQMHDLPAEAIQAEPGGLASGQQCAP